MNDITGPRFDAIPDGCPDLGIPSCLTCPLPQCRYDMESKQAAMLLRDRPVADLLAGGRSAEDVAAALGISRRSVYRAKRRIAAAGGTAQTSTPERARRCEGNTRQVCPDSTLRAEAVSRPATGQETRVTAKGRTRG